MKFSVKAWFVLSLFIAGVVSLFASSHPDGFEKAGEETGYIHGATSYFPSPLPDYALPGISSWLSNSLAGIIGVIVTYILFTLMGKWMGKNEK